MHAPTEEELILDPGDEQKLGMMPLTPFGGGTGWLSALKNALRPTAVGTAGTAQDVGKAASVGRASTVVPEATGVSSKAIQGLQDVGLGGNEFAAVDDAGQMIGAASKARQFGKPAQRFPDWQQMYDARQGLGGGRTPGSVVTILD
jgi:hypothetical protein